MGNQSVTIHPTPKVSEDVYADDNEFEFEDEDDDEELSDYMKNAQDRDDEKQIVYEYEVDDLKKMSKAQTIHIHRSQSTADYGMNGFGDAGKEKKNLLIKVEQVPAKVGWTKHV